MRRTLKIFCCLFFILIPPLFATNLENQIGLSTNKTNIPLNGSTDITVTIKARNASEVNFSDIHIPGVESFDVHGTSTSIQSVFINGIVSSETQEILSLFPKKSGKFTLGPITYSSSGILLKSNSIDIIVSKQADSLVSVPPTVDSYPSQNGEANILDEVIILSGILLFTVVFVGIIWRYRHRIVHLPKNIGTVEKTFSPPLTTEDALNLLKNHFKEKYHIDTASFTSEELLTLEKNPEQKHILQKCLLAIQLREYGNTLVNNQELLHLLKQYLKHEQSGTN